MGVIYLPFLPSDPFRTNRIVNYGETAKLVVPLPTQTFTIPVGKPLNSNIQTSQYANNVPQ